MENEKLSPIKEVLDAIHIEGQGEAERLIERITLGRSDDITNIQREDVHAEAGT